MYQFPQITSDRESRCVCADLWMWVLIWRLWFLVAIFERLQQQSLFVFLLFLTWNVAESTLFTLFRRSYALHSPLCVYLEFCDNTVSTWHSGQQTHLRWFKYVMCEYRLEGEFKRVLRKLGGSEDINISGYQKPCRKDGDFLSNTQFRLLEMLPHS